MKVSEWREADNHDFAVEYIQDEAERFVKFYRHLIKKMPEVWQEFAKANGIGQDN
ncbi:hypothetical protein ACFLYB_04340 [Chloroflexota bacterium]